MLIELRHWLLALISFVLWSSSAQALQVALIAFQDASGKIVPLEAGGHYGHVALRVQMPDGKLQWLHAHPYYGVVLQQDISHKNEVIDIFSAGTEEIQYEHIRDYVGLKYDPQFRWEDPLTTYCSKLVGQILNMKPKPMHFDAPFWKDQKDHLQSGALGISPDDIYRELLNRGFKKN